MYEDFKIARPEMSVDSVDGQKGEDVMEKILLAAENAKQWAIKVFGQTKYEKSEDGKTRATTVTRKISKADRINTGNLIAEELVESYKETAEKYKESQNKNLSDSKELETLEGKIKDKGYNILTEGEKKRYGELTGVLTELSDGAINEWIGYAPTFKDAQELDYNASAESNVKYDGMGQLGIIMLDFQWNSMVEEKGFAELSKPMYDKKMWEENGSLMQPPTFREVLDVTLEVVGNATGHKWVGYLDDALFAMTDLTGAYKSAAEVGLELGKKAATAAISAGMGKASNYLGDLAGEALQGAGTAANVAAQAGISMASSYATSVANSAINSVYINKDGNLDFAGDSFVESLYSKNTMASVLSTAASTSISMGGKAFFTNDGNGLGLTDKVFNIKGMSALADMTANATAAGITYGMTGKTTVNLLNFGMFGVTNPEGDLVTSGLLELTFDKENGVSSTIGSGGFDMNVGKLTSALGGLHDALKVTEAKVSEAFGEQEAISTLNAVNILGYTGESFDIGLARDIWKEKIAVEYDDVEGEYGHYDLDTGKITFSDVLLGNGKEGSAKLASVMAHEGTHAYGNRIEGIAHSQAANTYSIINNMFGLKADSKFSKRMIAGMLDSNSWVENTDNMDYWKVLSDGNIIWDGQYDLVDENGQLLEKAESKTLSSSYAQFMNISKEEAARILSSDKLNISYRDGKIFSYNEKTGQFDIDRTNDESFIFETLDDFKVHYDFQHNYIDKLNESYGGSISAALNSFQTDVLMGNQKISANPDFYKSEDYLNFLLANSTFASAYDQAVSKYGNVGNNKITDEIFDNVSSQASFQSDDNILYEYLKDGTISPVVGKSIITTKTLYDKDIPELGIKKDDPHSKIGGIAADLWTFNKDVPVVSVFNSNFLVNSSYGLTPGGGNFISLYSNGLKIDYKHLLSNSYAYSTMNNLNTHANNAGIWRFPIPSNYQIGNVGNTGKLTTNPHLHFEYSKKALR